MKLFIKSSVAFLTGFVLSAALALSLVQPKNQFTLLWDHVTPATNDDTLCFVLYTSADLNKPVTNWSVFTNISASNAWTGIMENGTNFLYALSNTPALSKQQYFFVTASNFYGESLPSNTVTSAPALTPVIQNSLRIER